uniref:Ubiquitin-like protease family profile domain-containing protein n=1 Tax=Ditylenchus dipsaci TaxID=166011 RepID=A0A915EQ57_9BILA
MCMNNFVHLEASQDIKEEGSKDVKGEAAANNATVVLGDSSFEKSLLDEFYINNAAVVNQADILTLLPKEWLNDRVIDFYLEMIVQRSIKNSTLPKVYTLSCHFYTSLIANGYAEVQSWINVDIFSFNLVLVPIHLPVNFSTTNPSTNGKMIWDIRRGTTTAGRRSHCNRMDSTVGFYVSVRQMPVRGSTDHIQSTRHEGFREGMIEEIKKGELKEN